MTGATIPTFGAILVQLALGLAVFQANRHRLPNQCFLLLSLIVGAWLGSIYLAFVATNPQVAEFAIRQASATGVLHLAPLNLLPISVRRSQEGWRGIHPDRRGRSHRHLSATHIYFGRVYGASTLDVVRAVSHDHLQPGNRLWHRHAEDHGGGRLSSTCNVLHVADAVSPGALRRGLVAGHYRPALSFRGTFGCARGRRHCRRLCHGPTPGRLPAPGRASLY